MMTFARQTLSLNRAARALGLLVFVLFSSTASYAQDTIAAQPAMWKMEKDGSTVYLLGTFHLLTPEVQWQTPRIMDAFNAAESLTVEVTDEDMVSQKIMALVQQVGMYPPTDSLKNHIPEEMFAELSAQGGAVGLPAQFLERFKPWFAAITVALQHAQANGFSPALGVDFTLMAKARATGKPVQGLERAEEQLAMLSSHPPEVQEQMLADTLRQIEELNELWDSMIAAWSSGDEAALDKLMVDGMRELPELYQVLLVNRNHNWVPRIKVLLNTSGQHFVAVGAAHLVGKDSVIAMLEAEGYSAERVME